MRPHPFAVLGFLVAVGLAALIAACAVNFGGGA
jgi:hypothetical protein